MLHRRLIPAAVGAAALALCVQAAPASAQGLFEALFGGLRRAISAPETRGYAPERDPVGGFIDRLTAPEAAPRRTASAPSSPHRGFCVRLCDGFHAPIGYLRSSSDLKAHQALCEAMNPGLPVKVFTIAAGAASIDKAVAADGQRYGALPTAYRHETTANPACRLPIAKAGEHRVSLLRDITLRPGDSIVLDGKVTTFMGGSSWPYSHRDFRDFRSAPELTKAQRRQIDEQVGISRMEAQLRNVRRQMRVREARLESDTASDAFLRGSFDAAGTQTPVRMIPIALAQ